jgi:predicted nucleic acid-binding protein
LIVVDASLLTDVLLVRPSAVAALRDAMVGHEDEPLHAPAVIELEILNALRGMTRGGHVTDRRSDDAVAGLAKVRMVRYSHGPFRRRVWELRHDLTAYDAVYLALAERIAGSILITGDAGLAARAGRSLGKDRVRHVA